MFPDSWWTSGAIISLPDKSIAIGYGIREWKRTKDLDPSRPAFYAPDFFLENDQPWCQFEYNKTIHQLDNSSTASFECLQNIDWNPLNNSHFNSAFADIKAKISSSKLYKAVPYTFLQSDEQMSGMKLKRSIHSALSFLHRNKGYIYGIWEKQEGILGVTPEVLFQSENSVLMTMALAGTKSKNESRESLLNDSKEIHEHELVVRGIQESLNPYGKVNIGVRDIIELPTLMHLKTPIEVILNTQPNFETLVSALHPTPALGAFPKLVGWEWLKQFQKIEPRNRYGAPFGYRDSETLSCLVAIRNMQWDNSGIRLGAGCGVVQDSLLEKEWAEVQLKIGSIKAILGMK